MVSKSQGAPVCIALCLPETSAQAPLRGSHFLCLISRPLEALSSHCPVQLSSSLNGRRLCILVFACTKVTAVFSDWNVVDQTPDPLSLLGSVRLPYRQAATPHRVCPSPLPPICKARPARAQAHCAARRISCSTLGHHTLGSCFSQPVWGGGRPCFPPAPTCDSPQALLPQQPARTGRWQHSPGLCS